MKTFLAKLYYSLFIGGKKTILLYNYNEVILITNINDFVDGLVNKNYTLKPFGKNF